MANEIPANAANLQMGVSDSTGNSPIKSANSMPSWDYKVPEYNGNGFLEFMGWDTNAQNAYARDWDKYNAAREAYEFEFSNWFNANEAEKQRNWEEMMSNSSVQRRMADLQAAGLNPLLAVESAQSGASTPSGSAAHAATGKGGTERTQSQSNKSNGNDIAKTITSAAKLLILLGLLA